MRSTDPRLDESQWRAGGPTSEACGLAPDAREGGAGDESLVHLAAADGFPLVLERLRPPAIANATGLPVVLCPGFGGNRFNFDLDPSHSLALMLRRSGFDVWLAELRGSGRSRLPKLSSGRSARPYWTMDDHVEHDVPALLRAVEERSGRSELIWIGHSLGGMVAYCALARFPEYQRHFAGLITLGSPGPLGPARPETACSLAAALLKVLRRRRPLSPVLAARALFSRPAHRLGLAALQRRFVNLENVSEEVIARTIDVGLEPLSLGVLSQWALSMRHKSLVSHDESFDYFRHFDRIRVPLLLIAGTRDRLASLDTILAVADRVSSVDRCVRAFGRRGFEKVNSSPCVPCVDRVDYGHEDLLVGEASPREVYPYLVRWIALRNGLGE